MSDKESKTRKSKPASTLEGRENQLVALATDLAEQQMRAGTASAQVISHYLKLGSTREQLEQERLRAENKVLAAKEEAMGSVKHLETLMKEAMDAFRTYAGQDVVDYDDQ